MPDNIGYGIKPDKQNMGNKHFSAPVHPQHHSKKTVSKNGK